MSWFGNLLRDSRKGIDLSILKTDVHSHLIPGIDDGSTSLENSIELIRSLQELGYSKLITTPHIMSDYYKNTSEIILSGLEVVRAELKKQGIAVELEAAAEYYCDSVFEKSIDQKKLLTFSGNHVLFELSYLNPPEIFETVTFKLQMEGYKPVLAHPERYPYWFQSYDKYNEIREKGILLQVNLGSLSGHYGSGSKRIAERLIDDKLVDIIGTDTHKMSHIELFKNKAVKETSLQRLIESGRLINSLL
jgi:tyrosine-protein phosphatase YwqE